jgi:hypothetical protein
MKELNYTNYFMVGIPVISILAGWAFVSGIAYIGILFTMLTGAFQVIAGLGLFFHSGCKDNAVGIYLVAVALFFTLWIFTDWHWIIALPPILALYLSVIIFIKAKNTKQ